MSIYLTLFLKTQQFSWSAKKPVIDGIQGNWGEDGEETPTLHAAMSAAWHGALQLAAGE